jgi:DNA-binding transcriptional ArsR family regulator
MANEKKMTKAQMFAQIKANYALTKAEVEFIDHEIELLTRKNTTEKKPTAKQTANDGIKTAIVEALTADPNRLFTITELTKTVPNLPEDMTPQRMSALVRQLKEAGVVERIEEKRVAYFRIAR